MIGLLTLIAAQPAVGQLGGSSEKVEVSATWNKPQARPGDQRVLAIVLDAAPGWHINPRFEQAKQVKAFNAIPTEVGFDGRQPAGPNEPTLIPPREAGEAHVPARLQPGPVQWPETHALEVTYANRAIPVYEGKTVLLLPVILADDAEPGTIELPLKVRYQTCDDARCLPPATTTITPTLEIVKKGASPGAAGGDPALFQGFDSSVFAAMQQGGGGPDYITFNAFGLFGEQGLRLNAATWWGFLGTLLIAAFGGLLLNFTPCVLPVIPLKIMGLANSAGHRGRTLALGAVMAAGVAGFWLTLGLILSTVSAITSANQLFQYPAFTITVGLLIAAMAVGMCGLFTVQLPRWVYSISPKQESYPGTFGFGVMTAVLSTPCTAPFMGAAAGWAATRSPAVALTAFFAIGLGMAMPYLVLSAWPGLAHRMPRTGPGSELLKQVMGLLMLAAAAFFVGSGLAVWLNEPPDPPSLAYWWVVGGFVAAAGLWLIVRVFQITGRSMKSVAWKFTQRGVWTAIGVIVIVAAGVGANSLDDRGPIDWRYYTPPRFQQAKANGEIVVMDFTADWCLNCKALEHAILFDKRVVDAIEQPGVTPMKVDITSRSNQAGWTMLKKMDRVTIPLLVVFAPDGEAVFKSDAYDVGDVLSAIERARR